MTEADKLNPRQEASEVPQVESPETSAPCAAGPAKFNKSRLTAAAAKRTFIEWLATPKALRQPETQKQFGDAFGVSEHKVSKWKHDPRILEQSEKLSIRHARWEFAEVLDCLVAEATGKTGGADLGEANGGNVTAMRLFLQYVMGWHEKVSVDDRDDTPIEFQVLVGGKPSPKLNLPTRPEPAGSRVN